MKITFWKKNPYTHQITVLRIDGTTEMIEAHTQTFFLLDLVHYCIERAIGISDGFWGMIAQGYVMAELSG